jgi:hypothetical protein
VQRIHYIAQHSHPLAHRYTPSKDTEGSSFSPESLSITVQMSGSGGATSTSTTTWRPGTAPNGNLKGTYHSLDCYSTPAQCVDVAEGLIEDGLVSRDGWAVVDDLSSLRLESAPQPNAALPWMTSANGTDLLDQVISFKHTHTHTRARARAHSSTTSNSTHASRKQASCRRTLLIDMTQTFVHTTVYDPRTY